MKKIIILIFFITSLFSSDINDKGICKYVINKSLLNNQISFTKQEKACVSVVLVSLYNRYLPKKVGNLKILQLSVLANTIEIPYQFINKYEKKQLLLIFKKIDIFLKKTDFKYFDTKVVIYDKNHKIITTKYIKEKKFNLKDKIKQEVLIKKK